MTSGINLNLSNAFSYQFDNYKLIIRAIASWDGYIPFSPNNIIDLLKFYDLNTIDVFDLNKIKIVSFNLNNIELTYLNSVETSPPVFIDRRI